VSTVDSGNLAAALISLGQGLAAIAAHPQTRRQLLEGVIDTADLLASAAASSAAADRRIATVSRINVLAGQVVADARGELTGGAAASLAAVADEL